MTTNTELYNFLSSDPTIASLVGTRIYPAHIPQDAQFPCLMFAREDSGGYSDFDGQGGTLMTEMQTDCLALTLGEAVSVAEAVKAALKNFTGMMATRRVIRSTLNSEYDGYEAEVDVGVFRSSQSWTLWHY